MKEIRKTLCFAAIVASAVTVQAASKIRSAKLHSSPLDDAAGMESLVRAEYSSHFEETFLEAHHFETQNYERLTGSHKLDYGRKHPFEILEKRRLMKSEGYKFTETEEAEFQRNHTRNLSPWSSNSVYQNLRVHFDTTYLDIMDEKDKYAAIVEVLKTEIIPKVRNRWANALKVFRAQGNIVIQNHGCPYSQDSQKTIGIPNADVVIFVAANFESICNSRMALAASRSCQADQYDRSTVGAIILCLDKFDIKDDISKDAYEKTLVHEMTHVLGMRAKDLPFFYNPATGLPRTPRPLEKREVTCVDGNMVRLAPPSSNTLKAGFTKRGKLFYEVVTPTVRQVARNHFNCQQMGGARLENQPTNDGNCFGSHWEARLFASDVVAAIKTPTFQLLTPLTLALFDDSGWYKSDFEASNISPFGHGRGCDFVFEDCIVDGEVSEWGRGIFCNDLEGPNMEKRCDMTHTYITRCDLIDYNNYPGAEPPDRKHQYFPNNPVSYPVKWLIGIYWKQNSYSFNLTLTELWRPIAYS